MNVHPPNRYVSAHFSTHPTSFLSYIIYSSPRVGPMFANLRHPCPLIVPPVPTSTHPHSFSHNVNTTKDLRKQSLVGPTNDLARQNRRPFLLTMTKKLTESIRTNNSITTPPNSGISQPFDFTTLVSTLYHLNQFLIPSRVDGIHQVSSTTLAVNLTTVSPPPERLYQSIAGNKKTLSSHKNFSVLYLSWHPQYPYFTTASSTFSSLKNEALDTSLVLHLRSALLRMALVGIHIAAPFERVIRLDFAKAPLTPINKQHSPTFFHAYQIPSGVEYSIFLELNGAGKSNLVLVDAQRNVLACGRQISAKKAMRSMQIGDTYELPPPPPASKLVPILPKNQSEIQQARDLFQLRLQQSGQKNLAKALVKTYQGMSPMIVASLLYAAKSLSTTITIQQDPASSAAGNADHQIQNIDIIFQLWMYWLKLVSDPYNLENNISAALSDLIHTQKQNLFSDIHPFDASYEHAPDIVGFRYSPIAFPRLSHDNTQNGFTFASIAELIDWFYAKEQFQQEFLQCRTACLSKLEKVYKKCTARKDLFEAQRVGALKINQITNCGNWLLAYEHSWNMGDPCISVQQDPREFFDDIMVVSQNHSQNSNIDEDQITTRIQDGVIYFEYSIPQNSTPVEIAQKLHKKARKLKRADQILGPLLETVILQLQYIENVRNSLLQLDVSKENLEILSEIEEEVTGDIQKIGSSWSGMDAYQGLDAVESKQPSLSAKIMKNRKSMNEKKGKNEKNAKYRKNAKQPPEKKASAVGYLKFQVPGGLIMVGKNSKQNDNLSFNIATKDDLWLHARGCSGSHVILRMDNACNVEAEKALQSAADIAVWFSKARKSGGRIPVSYLPVKHIKRAPGGFLGMVIVDESTEKVIYGRPEKAAMIVERG